MIEVKGLAKRFCLPSNQGAQLRDPRDHDGWFHAVRDVSFSCAAGEVLGLLGPNGAGKTTALRLLSTALKADAGSALMNGVDLLQHPMLARATSSRNATPARSTGCQSLRRPFLFPSGVRSVSTMTAFCILPFRRRERHPKSYRYAHFHQSRRK